MSIDPVKANAGRKGGFKTGRKRMSHLTDAEYEALRELERQVRAYRAGEAGSPGAVVTSLRIIADELEANS